jgi:hypothetical protein
MWEFLQSSRLAQAVLWGSVLLVLCCVGVYVIKAVRERSDRGEPLSANDMLTGFRDMHNSGNISQDEFKKIKSVLGGRLHDEVESNNAGDDD